MKILILDDNEIVFRAPENYMVDPHDYRKDMVVQVATPSKFWDVYETEEWDEVWLDHDLGTPEYNGRTVTKEFQKLMYHDVNFDFTFYVTSMNPSGANDMVSDLVRYPGAKKVMYVPISTLGPWGVDRGLAIMNKNRVLRQNCEVRNQCPICGDIGDRTPGVICGRDLTEEINNKLGSNLPNHYVVCPGVPERMK